jgi:hypothetical protein
MGTNIYADSGRKSCVDSTTMSPTTTPTVASMNNDDNAHQCRLLHTRISFDRCRRRRHRRRHILDTERIKPVYLHNGEFHHVWLRTTGTPYKPPILKLPHRRRDNLRGRNFPAVGLALSSSTAAASSSLVHHAHKARWLQQSWCPLAKHRDRCNASNELHRCWICNNMPLCASREYKHGH